MKTIFLPILASMLLSVGFASAQNPTDKSPGIDFETGLTWTQIKEKAKQEGKMIFVDCYATWCIPCRRMDSCVYSNDSVGNFMNEKFISIKVQMDSTTKDNDAVRKWYSTAHELQQLYKILSFPSFLFFTPDGKIVHRELGGRNKEGFMLIASNALKPETQYFSLIEKYMKGEKNYATMPYLVNLSKSLKDKKTSELVARDYIENYLLHLNDDQLYTKNNIQFICSNTQSPDYKSFDLFTRSAGKIDSIMNIKGYANAIAVSLISGAEIDPVLVSENPKELQKELNKLFIALKAKYGYSLADQAILGSKISWYYDHKQWKDYVAVMVMKNQRYGFMQFPMTFVYMNNDAFEVFKYSTKASELKAALQWSEQAMRSSPDDPNLIDTYANLLYKLGQKKKAIAFEEKAISMHPKRDQADEFRANLLKMKSGEKTW